MEEMAATGDEVQKAGVRCQEHWREIVPPAVMAGSIRWHCSRVSKRNSKVLPRPSPALAVIGRRLAAEVEEQRNVSAPCVLDLRKLARWRAHVAASCASYSATTLPSVDAYWKKRPLWASRLFAHPAVNRRPARQSGKDGDESGKFIGVWL